MVGSMDNKSLVCIPVENNTCISCIYLEITVTESIINILSCDRPIDNVDSHTPYFDVFV